MADPARYRMSGFPPRDLDLIGLMSRVGSAHEALARYDCLVSMTPRADALLAPFALQEAVLSSTIEGTRATMREVLAIEAGATKEEFSQFRWDDAEEIVNCKAALAFAGDALARDPFSLDLLRKTHGRLMAGVRGEGKGPGSFRDRQNWIGPPGCGIENARFIPIQQEHLMGGIEAWLRYALEDDVPDPLIQLAIVHMEFEALHPFRDGNGRIGRMLIPLLLFRRGLLESPHFFFSDFLEEFRREYFSGLLAVSRDDAWSEWCEFFLYGLTEQAKKSHQKLEKVRDLRGKLTEEAAKQTRSAHIARIADFLFSRPVFSVMQLSQETGVPAATARRLLPSLTQVFGLEVARVSAGRKSAIYEFPALLDIIES